MNSLMNFKRILSKTSVISSSSGKYLTPTEEIIELQADIEKLKQTVDYLKNNLEIKDAAVGTLAREKDKLYVELKTAQRTNRNLHQQLEDERDIHSKEKEHLIDEIKRLSHKNYEHVAHRNVVLDDMENNFILSDEIKAKDEVIYNVCAKYLKMKSSKILLIKSLKILQSQCQKAFEKIVILLQENRNTLDCLLTRLIESTNTSQSNKDYLRLLKANANLHYENTKLKVHNSIKSTLEDVEIRGKLSNISRVSENMRKFSKSDAAMTNYIKSVQNVNHKSYHNSYVHNHYLIPIHFKCRLKKSHSDTCLLHKVLHKVHMKQ